MSRLLRFALPLALALALLRTDAADAQATADRISNLRGAPHVTVLATRVTNPVFRMPGDREGISGESTWSVGGRLGWVFIPSSRLALELAASGWRAGFPRLVARTDGGFGELENSYTIEDASLTDAFGDLAIHVLPSAHLPVSLYGVLGMGVELESYTITESDGAPHRDERSVTEFAYGYGLGARVFPVRRFSFMVEYRWIPGDLTSELEDCRSIGGGLQECTVGDQYSSNVAKALSVGVTVGIR